jgi:hypothetical protein
VRNWTGHIKGRSLQVGTILLISSDNSDEPGSIPLVTDRVCIHVTGEKFPAAVVSVNADMLTIHLIKGQVLGLKPVPVGHPAHGERSAPGVPTSVWKVTNVH